MELPKTLPASWYCSKPLYQLEQRAVFMKSWYLLGPVTRFQDDEEVVVEYEFAGVKLHVTKNQDDPKTPIVTYADGQPARSYLTETGLLFGAISDTAPPFEEYLPDVLHLLKRVDFTRLPHRRSLKYHGNFNWKTMVDGYQECLHCQYTHPSFSVLYPPTFYAVQNHVNFSQHIADPQKPDDGLFLYFFPNCTLNVYGGGMSSFRVCPTDDPGVTRMEFDYYHLETGDKFEEYFKFVRQVAMEDFELCEKAQANLQKGIYHEGILNPVKENGVAFYQQEVLRKVIEQHEEDKVSASNSAIRRDSFASTDSAAVTVPSTVVDPAGA